MNATKLTPLTRLTAVLCIMQPLACLTPPGLRQANTAAAPGGAAPRAPESTPEKMTELTAWARSPR